MNDISKLVAGIFKSNNITIPAERLSSWNHFLQQEENKALVNEIAQSGSKLITKWQMQQQIEDMMQQTMRIPNATVGKAYETIIDMEKLNWKDVASYQFSGLEEIGLHFDAAANKISGVPTQSGELKVVLHFKVAGESEEVPFHEKQLTLTVNPDPKSLWKNLESDKADPYWKEDNVTVFAPLGDKHILVSSRRGRSHANNGSFREDDFAFAELANGWCLAVVADGAGSAKISRKGSSLACQGIVDHFKDPSAAESMLAFDDILQQYQQNPGEEAGKMLNRFVYNNLGKAAFAVHKQLEEFAKSKELTLKDLSTTLIFCLWKKYSEGYVFLSFGVGDCPIAMLNKDITEVTLMNWIDVGEFGGGTRFITMPEIFRDEKFATRFGFKMISDFSYLFLMSDGIYDPKFVVESALPNIEKWKEFLEDLGGNNTEGAKVELVPGNTDIEQQFSKWMDFWSTGNHDDRTLAIIF